MAKLVFKGPGLQRIAAWNKTHDKFRGGFLNSSNEPGIILAKDEGIYIMSNAETPDLLTPNESARHCVYAEGFNPNGANPDWYDKAHRAVGGDDFGEVIALDKEQTDYLSRETCVITVKMTKTAMTVTFSI